MIDPELLELRSRRLAALMTDRERSETISREPARPTSLTGAAFGAFVRESPRAVVDVWAPWCGPCRAMAPVLDHLAAQFGGTIRFGKLNADNEPALAARWDVQGIPTLLIFENGHLVDRVIGAVPGEMLENRLRTVFRLPPAPNGPETA